MTQYNSDEFLCAPAKTPLVPMLKSYAQTKKISLKYFCYRTGKLTYYCSFSIEPSISNQPINNKEIAITKTFSLKSGARIMAVAKINENLSYKNFAICQSHEDNGYKRPVMLLLLTLHFFFQSSIVETV